MSENVIIHIPHASLDLPKEFFERLEVSLEELERENIFVADYLVDKFEPEEFKNVIKADFSRLFCDVERFRDDSQEVMSKYGMGVVYQKNHLGNNFIEVDDKYKNWVLTNYYDKYHKMLDEKASEILEKNKQCYIIELHSFSDQFVLDVLNLKNNPDICLGYDNDNCDFELLKLTKEHFEKYGYSVRENYPYQGSLVPNKFYGVENSGVFSLMIEINKRLYLKDNEDLVSSKFLKLKECMDSYYELVEDYVSLYR